MVVGVMAQTVNEHYALYNGDAAEVLSGFGTSSIDLIVTSPAFASLYTYSASDRDLGNSRTDAEFFQHFDFIVRELLRVLKPGRVAAIHVMDIPAMLSRDGYIGLKDFSGEVIRAFIRGGWVFDGRVPIDKNQQAQSIRTHSKALTMTQLEKDRTWMRPALPDYVLKFRRSGENTVPVRGGDVSRDEWIDWANPTWPNEDRCAEAGAFATWYGIREQDTLNAAEARTAEAERHICPLQLGTINRCVRLWSNAGEVVMDPFSGIGSVPFEAVKLGRFGLGVELNPPWHAVAVRNLDRAVTESTMPNLFSALDDPGRGPAGEGEGDNDG